MLNIRKTLAGAVAIVAIVAASATGALAGNGNNGAFLGGLAVGVIGSAIVNGAGAGAGDGYGYQGNGFYSQPVYVQRHCWFEVQPVYGAYGQYVGEQRIRRCN